MTLAHVLSDILAGVVQVGVVCVGGPLLLGLMRKVRAIIDQAQGDIEMTPAKDE